jgi:Na+/glutamate symporter
MSEGFHVHGPHDHELEHAAQHEPKGMAGQLAVITAILATVGAIFAYMAGATQANAGLAKNDAAIRQTLAADKWAEYQSKSNKQNLAELAADIAPEPRRGFYADATLRYKEEKKALEAEARKLEAASKEFDNQSAEQMHQHHRWAQATTALQIAIALAAIALLTKKPWMEKLVFGVSALGLAIGIAAWLHV